MPDAVHRRDEEYTRSRTHHESRSWQHTTDAGVRPPSKMHDVSSKPALLTTVTETSGDSSGTRLMLGNSFKILYASLRIFRTVLMLSFTTTTSIDKRERDGINRRNRGKEETLTSPGTRAQSTNQRHSARLKTYKATDTNFCVINTFISLYPKSRTGSQPLGRQWLPAAKRYSQPIRTQALNGLIHAQASALLRNNPSDRSCKMS